MDMLEHPVIRAMERRGEWNPPHYDHVCTWCGRGIPLGTPYYDLAPGIFCPDCLERCFGRVAGEE
jgi:hypothetical protein